MTQVISRYQGVVTVPLFDSGYDLFGTPGLVLAFQNTSYGPLLAQDSVTGSSYNLTFARGLMPRVGGVSALCQIGTPGPNNAGPVTWFDNRLHLSSGEVTPQFLYEKFMLDDPGTYDGSNLWNIIQVSADTNRGYISNWLPCIWQGYDAKMILYAVNSAVVINADVFIGNEFVGEASFPYNYGVGTAGVKFLINRLYQSQETGPFDNCLLSTASTDGSPLYRVLWSSSYGNDCQTTLSLSDPALDVYFQACQDFSIWQGGYVAILNTGGSGPTGQLAEVAVFNEDMSQYYLVKFAPQDADSEFQLSVNNGWSISIDNQGVLWFTNGDVATSSYRLSYSYSPVSYPFHIVYPNNLEPINLPCFNTCSPVTYQLD